MKFSVVIPLYNGADLIEATLDTVLSQTYKDYEIVLVNDGSPDNVGEVVKEYISLHPEVSFIYHEQENRGLGGARNTAIRHATGDVIAILDQDDVWYPDKLKRVAEIYKNDPGIDIICHSQKVCKDGEEVRIFRAGPYGEDMHRELLFVNNLLSTSASAFKKTIIDEVGNFSEDRENFHFVEDFDLWLRMAEKGKKFHFTDDILGEYTEHDSNFSKATGTMRKSELNVIEEHYKGLKKENKNKLDMVMNWVRKKRIIAVVHSRACREFYKTGQLFKCLISFLKAVFTGPFLIVTYIPAYCKKMQYQREHVR